MRLEFVLVNAGFIFDLISKYQQPVLNQHKTDELIFGYVSVSSWRTVTTSEGTELPEECQKSYCELVIFMCVCMYITCII